MYISNFIDSHLNYFRCPNRVSADLAKPLWTRENLGLVNASNSTQV